MQRKTTKRLKEASHHDIMWNCDISWREVSYMVLEISPLVINFCAKRAENLELKSELKKV